MKIYKIINITVLFLLIALNLHGSETDNYISWDKYIQDSTQEINRHYNELIRKTLRKINKRRFFRKSSCPKVTIAIGQALGRIDQKYTDHWIKKNKKIDQFPKQGFDNWDYLEDSIYKKAKKLGVNLSPTINIDGIYTGSDKISHFFGVGWLYYARYQLALKMNRRRDIPKQNKKIVAIKEALEFGLLTERIYLGEGPMASGVFSYGDMESNYQGFRFYRNLCEEKNSYLKKEGKNWKMVRDFDIRKYVGPKWDETYYTNHYTKARWKHVQPYLIKYCLWRLNPKIKARMEYYKSIDKPSHSSRYLEVKVKDGQAPNRVEHSLDELCKKHGF
jgi:hypothetical protein